MQLSTTPLEVTYLRTTSLKPDPRNPRVHSDKQVRQIAQSIESFGFNVPLLIDDQQQVIAGHGRLLAARESVDGEKDCHEEPKEGDHLVGRKAGLAHELDGGIGEHPEGEAREREANCLEIGDLFRSF